MMKIINNLLRGKKLSINHTPVTEEREMENTEMNNMKAAESTGNTNSQGVNHNY
jgi:hypothetical protein